MGGKSLQFIIINSVGDDSVIRNTDEGSLIADNGKNCTKCAKEETVVNEPVHHAVEEENDITRTNLSQSFVNGLPSEMLEEATTVLDNDCIEDGGQVIEPVHHAIKEENNITGADLSHNLAKSFLSEI